MEYVEKYFWFLCLCIGIVGFLITWFVLPCQAPIDEIGVIFALCHIPLIAFVLWAPFDKWFAIIKSKLLPKRTIKGV